MEQLVRVKRTFDNGTAQVIRIRESACSGDCHKCSGCGAAKEGIVLTVENPFIAKARLQALRRYMPISQNSLPKDTNYIPADYLFEELPEYQSFSRLGSTIAESMRMMADIQSFKSTLPGIDCGSCGAPTCRAFAEDVIKKTACPEDCRLKDVWQKAKETDKEV